MLVLYFDSYLVRGACFYLVKGVCLYLVRVIFYIYAECLSEVYFLGFYFASGVGSSGVALMNRKPSFVPFCSLRAVRWVLLV